MSFDFCVIEDFFTKGTYLLFGNHRSKLNEYFTMSSCVGENDATDAKERKKMKHLDSQKNRSCSSNRQMNKNKKLLLLQSYFFKWDILEKRKRTKFAMSSNHDELMSDDLGSFSTF